MQNGQELPKFQKLVVVYTLQGVPLLVCYRHAGAGDGQ